MAQCLVCKGAGEGYTFRTLEVQTLHVRDFSGEKRIQALGNFQDRTVCGDCARRWLEKSLAPGKRLTRACLPFALVLVAGILGTLLIRGEVFTLRLLGPAAIFCGLAGGCPESSSAGRNLPAGELIQAFFKTPDFCRSGQRRGRRFR